MAMIRRTGGADFPDKLKALVSGMPKSGKTTLLGTVPNIIIADTEPKANNLASLAHLDIPYVTINSSADLRELHMVLGSDALRTEAAKAAGLASIDAVAIDTMDTLQKILKRERMESERSTKFVRDDWAWLKEEMTKIIEGFTGLDLHVIFTVHLKSRDVGTDDNPMTKIMPGLEGAIADEIAGMVGYSMRSFRKEEFDPSSGTKYTKYWLQAEGDELYDFLGTRVGGVKLPSIIEPDFGTVYKAAMANRPSMQAAPQPQELNQSAAPIQPSSVQQPAPVQQQAPAAPAPQTVPGEVVQPVQQPAESGPDVGPAPQAQAPVQQAPEQAPQAPQAPANPTAKPDDGQPVNDAALQHLKQIYDALQIGFPEAKLRALTLGDARTTVRMWKAIQADNAEGKLPAGTTPETEMTDYLTAMELLPGADTPQASQEEAVEPKKDGTIPQVKAYVTEVPGQELARANEVFEIERSGGNRTSLMKWLEAQGASHGGIAPAPANTPVPGNPDVAPPVGPPPAAEQTAPAGPPPGDGVEHPADGTVSPPIEQAPAVQTPVQNAAPEQPATGVTPEAPVADATPTEEEAVQAAQQQLGGVVVEDTVNADAPCGVCGSQIDDPDIAKIAKTRFGKVMCVQDYIAATRA